MSDPTPPKRFRFSLGFLLAWMLLTGLLMSPLTDRKLPPNSMDLSTRIPRPETLGPNKRYLNLDQTYYGKVVRHLGVYTFTFSETDPETGKVTLHELVETHWFYEIVIVNLICFIALSFMICLGISIFMRNYRPVNVNPHD